MSRHHVNILLNEEVYLDRVVDLFSPEEIIERLPGNVQTYDIVRDFENVLCRNHEWFPEATEGMEVNEAYTEEG